LGFELAITAVELAVFGSYCNKKTFQNYSEYWMNDPAALSEIVHRFYSTTTKSMLRASVFAFLSASVSVISNVIVYRPGLTRDNPI